MTAPVKQTSKTTDSLRPFLGAIEDNVERSRALVQNSVEGWFTESARFLEQMALDAEETLEELQHCKSPLDALVVQQGWAATRAKAYVDAGLRLLQGAEAAKVKPAGSDAAPTEQGPSA